MTVVAQVMVWLGIDSDSGDGGGGGGGGGGFAVVAELAPDFSLA